MTRLIPLCLAAITGCPGPSGTCAELDCPAPPAASVDGCQAAADALPDADPTTVISVTADVFDGDGVETRDFVRLRFRCDCFGDPPRVRLIRADESGVSDIDGEVVPDVDGTFVILLEDGTVTRGSTWAVQPVDVDGKSGPIRCAPVQSTGV